MVWGWTAYFWSALDAAGGGAWWNNPTDRLAHGGVPFVEWYLQQMRNFEAQHSRRLLDYLDVHFYPPGTALAAAGDTATQAWRLRSTRLLWDASYSEESWIAEPVFLIPRMRVWVEANYPGTGTAVTEYNWGALDSINGALAQADVLGIFGRETLDLATLWAPPAAGDPGAFAFRMYRNADGAGHGFGESGVLATSTDEGRLSVYAAIRAWDGALTVMAINKTAGALTSPVTIETFAAASAAHVFSYGASNQRRWCRLPTQPVIGERLHHHFPGLLDHSHCRPPVPIPGVTPTPTKPATPTRTVTPTRTPTPTHRPRQPRRRLKSGGP